MQDAQPGENPGPDYVRKTGGQPSLKPLCQQAFRASHGHIHLPLAIGSIIRIHACDCRPAFTPHENQDTLVGCGHPWAGYTLRIANSGKEDGHIACIQTSEPV